MQCTERNMDLEQSYLQLLDELSPAAVAGYIESYMNRTALGFTRPLNSLETNDTTLKVDCLLATGEMATDLSRAMAEMNGNMDPAKTQFISVCSCFCYELPCCAVIQLTAINILVSTLI